MNVIAAKQISKSFGSIQAVKQISFDLEGGEILGLIGLTVPERPPPSV